MKRILAAIIGLLVSAGGVHLSHATEPAGRLYCSGCNVETAPSGGRAVGLARTWTTVFQDRFDQGLDAWRVTNYRNALEITARTAEPPTAGKVLFIARPGEECDTAFELASRQLPVAAGAWYELTVVAKHNLDLQQALGHGKSFQTELQWQRQDGCVIGSVPFRLGDKSESPYPRTVHAQAPEGAAKAVIRIGFDSPNLCRGRYLALADVTLRVRAEPTRYVAKGELVSRPLRLPTLETPPTLLWRADIPSGTGVKFQVRSAADDDGGPKAWTEFLGPDGKASSFYTTSGTPLPAAQRAHRWFQYRVTLTTTKDSATSLMREVRIENGPQSVVDRSWAAPDTNPPVLVQCSPQRTTRPEGPIVFSVADGPDGVGVDRHTVEAILDGQVITSQLTRQADGSLRYDLPNPLQPPCGLAGWNCWTISNFEDGLTIEDGSPRLPGNAPSLVVRGRGPRRDTAFTLQSPLLKVQAGATYQFSCWSRHALDLGTAGGKPGSYVNGLQWLDASGKPLGDAVRFNLGPANPAWHQDRIAARAPEGAKSAVVRLGWDWPDLTDGTEVAFADPKLDGPVSDDPNEPNLHRVTVEAKDFAGNLLRRDWWILVAEPPAEGHAAMREDGVILVDGRPFFPIGMYAVWKREHNQNDFERCFAELAAAGFNTVHTYNAARNVELEEFYRVAHRYKIKVFLAARTGANNQSPSAAIRDAAAECRQPALLAWYLADDTASHISPARLRLVHDAVKGIDPFHLTVQADGVGAPDHSRYATYVDSTDAFLPELYPIRSAEKGEVAEIIRDMKTIAADLKRAGRRAPVWAIIQAFEGWGWQRYPTEAELRAMTYLAIIHGATGMTYYTYGGHGANHGATHDPRIWAATKQIAKELTTLHDALVERETPQTQEVQLISGPDKDALGYPAVSTRLLVHAGKHYLLAANSARAAVGVKIVLRDAPGVTRVLFEDRTVSVQAGVLEDRFAPHGVHVYTW